MSHAAVVAAAGRGLRLGDGDPKALRQVAGVPIVVRALWALDASAVLTGGVVVAPPEEAGAVRAMVRAAGLGARWPVVGGGSTRQASVGQGLRALPADVDVVLVHDAARPFVPAEVVRRVVAAVAAGADAVVPAVPLVDTLKRVDGEAVSSTVERSALRRAQTPQGFRRAVLEAAYAAAGAALATDDAGLVERAGGRVVVVDGDPLAFKVTGPLDLLLAEALVAAGLATAQPGPPQGRGHA